MISHGCSAATATRAKTNDALQCQRCWTLWSKDCGPKESTQSPCYILKDWKLHCQEPNSSVPVLSDTETVEKQPKCMLLCRKFVNTARTLRLLWCGCLLNCEESSKVVRSTEMSLWWSFGETMQNPFSSSKRKSDKGFLKDVFLCKILLDDSSWICYRNHSSFGDAHVLVTPMVVTSQSVYFRHPFFWFEVCQFCLEFTPQKGTLPSILTQNSFQRNWLNLVFTPSKGILSFFWWFYHWVQKCEPKKMTVFCISNTPTFWCHILVQKSVPCTYTWANTAVPCAHRFLAKGPRVIHQISQHQLALEDVGLISFLNQGAWMKTGCWSWFYLSFYRSTPSWARKMAHVYTSG